MKRTFASEDRRKDKLFESWNQHVSKTDFNFTESEFEEVYEGSAVVSDLSKNQIGFHLDDGESYDIL